MADASLCCLAEPVFVVPIGGVVLRASCKLRAVSFCAVGGPALERTAAAARARRSGGEHEAVVSSLPLILRACRRSARCQPSPACQPSHAEQASSSRSTRPPASPWTLALGSAGAREAPRRQCCPAGAPLKPQPSAARRRSPPLSPLTARFPNADAAGLVSTGHGSHAGGRGPGVARRRPARRRPRRQAVGDSALGSGGCDHAGGVRALVLLRAAEWLMPRRRKRRRLIASPNNHPAGHAAAWRPRRLPLPRRPPRGCGSRRTQRAAQPNSCR